MLAFRSNILSLWTTSPSSASASVSSPFSLCSDSGSASAPFPAFRPLCIRQRRGDSCPTGIQVTLYTKQARQAVALVLLPGWLTQGHDFF